VTNMCPVCGRELTQKRRSTLSICGVALVIAAIPLLYRRYIWLLAILMAATGLYLLIWSVFGKGKWCTRCKKFPISKSLAR
jgi:hypothetical protein